MCGPSGSGAGTGRHEPEVDRTVLQVAAKLDPLGQEEEATTKARNIPRIGHQVDGVIVEVISRVGAVIDIGASCAAFLPSEEFGRRIRRPRRGYRLAFLEVLDVDLDAEEPRKILLGAQHCINLTPSPMLVSPSESCLQSPELSRQTSPEPSRPPSPVLAALASPARLSPVLAALASPGLRLSPVPSRRTSPAPSRRVSPRGSRRTSPVASRQPSPCTSPALPPEPAPAWWEPEPLTLPLPAAQFLEPAPPELAAAAAVRPRRAGSRKVPRRAAPSLGHSAEAAPRAGCGCVAPLREALLARAGQLGVRRARLQPVLRSLDVLELRLAVAEKAVQLGIPSERLKPVLRTLDALGGARGAGRGAAAAPEGAPRCWHSSTRREMDRGLSVA